MAIPPFLVIIVNIHVLPNLSFIRKRAVIRKGIIAQFRLSNCPVISREPSLFLHLQQRDIFNGKCMFQRLFCNDMQLDQARNLRGIRSGE